MTEQEVADFLVVKLTTLQYWRRGGLIPFIKMGSKVRYLKEDVDKFVLDNRQPLTNEMESFIHRYKKAAV
jgi:excisionase family DNA binding protein